MSVEELLRWLSLLAGPTALALTAYRFLADTGRQTVNDLREEVKRLREEVSALRTRNADLEAETREQRDEIYELRGELVACRQGRRHPPGSGQGGDDD